MKKNMIIGLLLLLAIIAITGCSTSTTGRVTQASVIIQEIDADTDTTETVQDASEEEVKVFNVKAFRFGYSPSVITVNKGDKVKIIIDNEDTTHGIFLSEFGVSIKKGDAEFIADKAGEFTWFCNNFCGSGHRQMKGTLIVKDQ